MSFLPQQLGRDSRSWKRSPAAGEGFPELETFPSSWRRIPGAGNVPQQLAKDSRSWKCSPAAGEGFPELETFPSNWGRIPGTGKAPQSLGKDSKERKSLSLKSRKLQLWRSSSFIIPKHKNDILSYKSKMYLSAMNSNTNCFYQKLGLNKYLHFKYIYT